MCTYIYMCTGVESMHNSPTWEIASLDLTVEWRWPEVRSKRFPPCMVQFNRRPLCEAGGYSWPQVRLFWGPWKHDGRGVGTGMDIASSELISYRAPFKFWINLKSPPPSPVGRLYLSLWKIVTLKKMENKNSYSNIFLYEAWFPCWLCSMHISTLHY